MSSMEEDVVEELRASYAKYGPLRRVVVTQFGIAAGETRKKAVPEWPEVKKDVKDYYEHLRLKAADNIQGLKPPSWWEKVVNDAAKELEKKGARPGDITKKLIEDFPLSERRIMLYLREEFKQPVKVEAGRAGGEKSAERRSAEHGKEEPETSKISKETPAPVEAEGGPEKKEPFAKGQSPTLKQNLVGEFTPSQMCLIGGLQYLHVPYKSEFYVPVHKYNCPKCRATYADAEVPDWDGKAGGRLCPKDLEALEQVQMKCDILVQSAAGFSVSLEVEGEGSSSKDNVEREKLLLQQNVRTAHIPNPMADKYQEEIAGLVKAFLL